MSTFPKEMYVPLVVHEMIWELPPTKAIATLPVYANEEDAKAEHPGKKLIKVVLTDGSM